MNPMNMSTRVPIAMTKGQYTKQTSATLSKFVIVCGKLRAKSISLWTDSTSITVDIAEETMNLRRDSEVVEHRKVVVEDGEKNKKEVVLMILGTHNYRPPKKPASYSNGEITKFGSVPMPAEAKCKLIEQYPSLCEIIRERVSDPYERRHSSTTFTTHPQIIDLNHLAVRCFSCGRKNQDMPKIKSVEHVHVEVEWYIYRGWHDRDSSKNMWT